jgi:hypothetical protein
MCHREDQIQRFARRNAKENINNQSPYRKVLSPVLTILVKKMGDINMVEESEQILQRKK